MNLREQNELICTCICRQTELYCEWAKRCGMSYNTMMTLYALHLEPGITQKAITQGWLLPKQTVNTVVKDLERRGYVSLRAGRDQKEKLVDLTPAGRAFAAPCLQEIYELEDRAVDAMGQERFREMVEANTAFTRAFAREVHGA